MLSALGDQVLPTADRYPLLAFASIVALAVYVRAIAQGARAAAQYRSAWDGRARMQRIPRDTLSRGALVFGTILLARVVLGAGVVAVRAVLATWALLPGRGQALLALAALLLVVVEVLVFVFYGGRWLDRVTTDSACHEGLRMIAFGPAGVGKTVAIVPGVPLSPEALSILQRVHGGVQHDRIH